MNNSNQKPGQQVDPTLDITTTHKFPLQGEEMQDSVFDPPESAGATAGGSAPNKELDGEERIS